MAQPHHFSQSGLWFLNSTALLRMPMRWLLDENLAEAINAPAHGLSAEEVEANLLTLLARGLVYVTHDDVVVDDPTPADVQRALREPWDQRPAWHLGLTPVGGVAWEQATGWDWLSFVDTTFADREDGRTSTGEFIGQDAELVRLEVDRSCQSEGELIPGTTRWDIISPWEATYWKRLPWGYRMRFDCHSREG